MRVRLHPGAERDLESAGDWYEQQRPGLGADLAEDLEHALEAIAERPSTWPLWPGIAAEFEVRRFLLARFPAVAYVAQLEITVPAVAHLRRRPGYWLERRSGGAVPRWAGSRQPLDATQS